jgi:hypothetical protein
MRWNNPFNSEKMRLEARGWTFAIYPPIQMGYKAGVTEYMHVPSFQNSERDAGITPLKNSAYSESTYTKKKSIGCWP